MSYRRPVCYLAVCLTALLVIATLALATARTARAQSSSNEGTPTILAALAQLQSSVNSIAAVVTGLQTSVTTLSTAVAGLGTSQASNVKSTPPMVFGDDPSIICTLANVDNAPHAIRAEVIKGFQGTVVNGFGGGYLVQPGEAQAGSFSLPGGSDVYYCRFTVIDGTRADVLGTAERSSGGPRTVVAAE